MPPRRVANGRHVPFGKLKMAAEIVVDNEARSGGFHHIVDALLRQGWLGGNISCPAFKHGQHGRDLLRAVAHHNPDVFRRGDTVVELGQDTVGHSVEIREADGAVVFDNGGIIRIFFGDFLEAGIYGVVCHILFVS